MHLRKATMDKQQALETLWGIAVADAIGNPLEFKYVVHDFEFDQVCNEALLHPSDDTQMTLFNYEGLLTGTTGTATPLLRWFETQHKLKPTKEAKGLCAFPNLYRREAPGSTCMGSCASLRAGNTVINDSKGNGTVMRASPFAVDAYVRGKDKAVAYDNAKADALMTHKHPMAWQASVILVAIYLNLFSSSTDSKEALFHHAVDDALHDFRGLTEITALVGSMFNKQEYEALRSKKCGWVAEEALALAVGAVAHHNTGYMNIVREACKGVQVDSDTVAGIAGGLAVAVGHEVPQEFKDKLYCSSAIRYIIDLYSEF